jgi:hypothetical protein
MKQLLMAAIGMLLAGSAYGSKLCVGAKVHEYVVDQEQMFEGKAAEYLEIMSTVGHPMDQPGAKSVLAGNGVVCNDKRGCVSSILVIRLDVGSPVIDFKAFCKKSKLKRAGK